MVDQQHHDAADERDQDAPEVESGYAAAAKKAEYNAANNAPCTVLAKRLIPGVPSEMNYVSFLGAGQNAMFGELSPPFAHGRNAQLRDG